MASTYTDRIGLEKQGDGENANTWGLRLNSNVIDLVDEAVAGYETITLSSGETTLTDTQATSNQARNMGLKFNGTLSADCTVVIPATEKVYFVHNGTSGEYDVYIKPSGGTAIKLVDQGESEMIASDGTTVNTLEGKTSVTNAANIYVSATDADVNYRLVFTTATDTSGNQALYKDVSAVAYYNPLNNLMTVPNLNVTGITSLVGIVATSIVAATGTFSGVVSAATLDANAFIGGTGSFSTVSATGNIISGANITATGNVTAYSDQRLKSKIETLDGNKAFDMRGVSFVKDGKESSGVIAQELEQVAPELVDSSGEYKSVAYGNVVGYLIEAVKLLKQELEELKGNK